MSSFTVEFLVQDCSSLLGLQAFLEGATAPSGLHNVTVRLRPIAFGLVPPCPITPHGMVPDSHRHLLGVRDQ
jgi:hypothetical protein